MSPGGRSARLWRLKFEQRIRDGVVKDQAELARQDPSRVAQIMNLLNVAAPIQEQLPAFPVVRTGRDVVTERAIRPIIVLACWQAQKNVWVALTGV